MMFPKIYSKHQKRCKKIADTLATLGAILLFVGVVLVAIEGIGAGAFFPFFSLLLFILSGIFYEETKKDDKSTP